MKNTKKLLKELRYDQGMCSDFINGQLIEDILGLIEEEGITKKQFAKRINRSKHWLKAVLREDVFLSIRDVAVITTTFKRKVSFRIRKKE